ncbi:hypothetical protein [Amycolatopsis sp. NPDC059657]|uniref:hypothetical protein n=1 Tax=Amycolatopsis sp. NPDC059657 TaxID=3346899 RepID=UPI00367235A3
MTNRYSCTVCTGTFDQLPSAAKPVCAHGGDLVPIPVSDQAATGCFDRPRFNGSVFARQNFVSSLGRGRFDCRYDQHTGVMDVIVKIDLGAGDVPQAEQQALAAKFKNRVPAYWNDRWTFRCRRPGWTDLPPVTCRFQVEVVPPGQSHFTLALSRPKEDPAKVQKGRPIYLRECRGFLSLKQVTSGNPQAKDQLDLLDFHLDDFAHVLAAQIITTHERKRLQTAMASMWNYFTLPLRVRRDNQDTTISATVSALFLGFDGEITSTLADKLTDFSKIAGRRVPGTRAVPIIISPPGDKIVEKREDWDAQARRVVEFLQKLPDGNTIALGSPIPEAVTLTIRIDEELEQSDLNDLQYNVSVHEFGHMLGLPDEYENPEDSPGAKPDDRAKAMVKAEYLKLCQLAGLAAPNFPSHTSSMMSDGMTVLPFHAVTVWDALCKLTQPYLAPHHWEIRAV